MKILKDGHYLKNENISLGMHSITLMKIKFCLEDIIEINNNRT